MAVPTIRRVRTRLVGTTPLMMHNVQLADPDNEYTKAIAKITAKRSKMTEQDRLDKARLEFLGGLYVEEGRIVMPWANVRRCFQEAAKATRQGKNIVRAVNHAKPSDPEASLLSVDLVFSDPKLTPEELWEKKRKTYADTTIVGVTGKVPRTRPKFDPWALVTDWTLITNLLGFEEFSEIVKQAGMIEGLGDNRVNGMGRFDAEITELS